MIELFSDMLLYLQGLCWGRRSESVDGGGNGDARFGGRAREGRARDDGFHMRGSNPPFRYEAISRQAAMQDAAAGSVLIVDVTADDDAQAFDIEEGVFDLQGIEGPFDQFDVTIQSPQALFEFEATTDAGIAIVGQDAEHVAMDVELRAGFEAGNAEAEGDHFGAVESAEDLAADFVCDDEKALGEEFDVVVAPDLALETDDGGEFFQLIELANFYVVRLGHVR